MNLQAEMLKCLKYEMIPAIIITIGLKVRSNAFEFEKESLGWTEK